MVLGLYRLRFLRSGARVAQIDDQGNLEPCSIRGAEVEIGDLARASAAGAGAIGPGVTNAVANTLNLGANAIIQERLGISDAVFTQQVFGEGTDNAYTTGAAAVAAQQGPDSCLDVTAGGAGNVLLATGAALDAAFPSVQVGSSWVWYVQNNLGGAAAATLTASAGHTIEANSTAAIADQITAGVLTRRTAAATYVSRVVTRGTH